jgi:hypothetical protein
MVSEQRCPICQAVVSPSVRYPRYICSRCRTEAVDEDGRPLGFDFSPSEGFFAWYEDTKEARDSGICFIRGVRCLAGEEYWGGVVVYPYEGE